MVFFQYWVSFFSTVLLIYSYITIENCVGTVEWFLVNTLLSHQMFTYQMNYVIAPLLIFSFFLKLGIAPFQILKVEVYNGLPFLSIFFYTIYYFLIFFSFFIYFLLHMLIVYSYIYYLIVYTLICIGIVYLVSLLFDITQIKAFLTYSTVLNSIGFLILFLVNL